jgi:Family of unknown function (DUF5675)
MELELIRTYHPGGTTGMIFYQGSILSFCIELPWKDNHTRVSCIPEGKYRLVKRYNPHFDEHFEVMDVPGRTGILIHPANDALLELKGCIAPVTIAIGVNRGWRSREALAKIVQFTQYAFWSGDPFFLTIKTML